MAKLYGVAIHAIRNRGHQEIAPDAVFTAENAEATKEYWRLERAGAIREATDDEAKLYDAKVADGETPSIVLLATAEEFAAANEAFTGSVNTGGTADRTAEKNAEDDAEKKADEAKKASEASSKTAPSKTTAAKKDDDI